MDRCLTPWLRDAGERGDSATPLNLMEVLMNAGAEIDWGTLRCPTFQQLRDLKKDDDRVHFDSAVAVLPLVALGTLRRIKNSSARCPVCRLIWKIILRDQGGVEPELTDSSAGDRHFECFARVQWFGQFSAPGGPPLPATDNTDRRTGRDARQNLVRRLSLRIGVPPSDSEDEVECRWYYILFCIQACPATATSVTPAIAFEASTDSPALVFGGRSRPLKIDLDWIREWMTICANGHTVDCGSWNALQILTAPQHRAQTSSPNNDLLRLPAIRLINVSSKCIEAFGSATDSKTVTVPAYAALSYVWGKDQLIKLRTTNVQSLSQIGALERSSPSRSIVDAIELVSKLDVGIEYLWVDALCIIQDSDEDKAMQIGRMGKTYAAAEFTIVIATGEDADIGLPGLHQGTRDVAQSIVEVIPPGAHGYSDNGLKYYEHGLAMMDTLSPLWNEDQDFWTTEKYSTRGWTMQERVLSKRKLIFTREQVYWQCDTSTYCEESVMEPGMTTFKPWYPGGSTPESLHRALQLSTPSNSAEESGTSEDLLWHDLQFLATGFSSLEFTVDGDAADGFSGILQVLSEASKEAFHWGIPTSRFALAMLFTNTPDVRRRQALTTLPITSMQQRVRIPSWSWLGWSDILMHFVETPSLMFPVLSCYTHGPGGMSLTPIRAADGSTYGFAQPPDPDDESLRRHWTGSSDLSVSLQHLATELPAVYNNLSLTPEGVLLFFWTSKASFRVENFNDVPVILSEKPTTPTRLERWRHRKTEVIDGKDHYFVGDFHGNTMGDMNWNSKLSSNKKSASTHDFIVVGEYSPSVPGAGYYLVVMMIGYENDAIQGQVAMRMASGMIAEDVWLDNNPTWSLVALG